MKIDRLKAQINAMAFTDEEAEVVINMVRARIRIKMRVRAGEYVFKNKTVDALLGDLIERLNKNP